MSLARLCIVLLVADHCQNGWQQVVFEVQNKRETTDVTTNSKKSEEVSTLPTSKGLSNIQRVGISDISVSPTVDDTVSPTIYKSVCPTVGNAVNPNVDDTYAAMTTPPNGLIQWTNDGSTRNSVVASTQAGEADRSTHPGTTEERITLENQTNNLITYAPKNETYLQAISKFTAFKLGKAINKYTQPVIVIVGVVGNTLSMLVMFQPHNRHTSFGVYLGILALSDTLVLCTSTSFWLVRLMSSSRLRDLECQIGAWVINALQMNGYFLIFSLTLDRLIAVRFPLKAVVWCSAIRAKLVAGLLWVIVWPLNVPFYIYNHVENKNICTLGTTGSVMSFVFPWIAIFVGFVVPFVSLVSMNVVIMVVILSRRRSRLTYAPGRKRDAAEAIEMSESTTGSSKQDHPQHQSSDTRQIHSKPMTSRDRNAIITLLLVSITFFK